MGFGVLVKLLLFRADRYYNNNQVDKALIIYKQAANLYDLQRNNLPEIARKLKFNIGIAHFLLAVDGKNVEENLNEALRHMDAYSNFFSISYIDQGYLTGSIQYTNSFYYRGVIYTQLSYIKSQKSNLLKAIKEFKEGMIDSENVYKTNYDLCLSGLKNAYEEIIEYFSDKNDFENENKYEKKLNELP